MQVRTTLERPTKLWSDLQYSFGERELGEEQLGGGGREDLSQTTTDEMNK